MGALYITGSLGRNEFDASCWRSWLSETSS